jgi:hypothetical protein
MRKWAARAAGFVGLSLLATGSFFAVMYLMVCEFARSIE